MNRPVGVPLSLAVVGILSTAIPQELSGQGVGIPIGTEATAVEIEDLDGQTVDLAQYIGQRPVLLEFWATWCPVCEKLAPALDRAFERYGDRVEFLVISVAVNQTQRSIKRHLNKHPLPFTVLWDTKGRATRAFQAPTTAYVVVLDTDGRVAYTGVGEDQDLVSALSTIVGN